MAIQNAGCPLWWAQDLDVGLAEFQWVAPAIVDRDGSGGDILTTYRSTHLPLQSILAHELETDLPFSLFANFVGL